MLLALTLSFISKEALAFIQEGISDGPMAFSKWESSFNPLLTAILGGVGGIMTGLESPY